MNSYMEVQEKLLKQISETKYLGVENTERYRPIMRLFYEKYERLEYWLYKENVFNELKTSEYFGDYTLELCEQDLLRLVEWKSLTSIQDTSNVATVQEFKNRKYRYQLTEYAIEIERLVMRLETLSVKTSSLEPKLFEKICILLKQIILAQELKEINELFLELNYNFTTLNESYKDFLKIFSEAKTEELMKSETFIIYKEKVINYLRDFIGGFQLNNIKIQEILKNVPEDMESRLMEALITYQKTIPNMEVDFDYDYLREINVYKWRSLIKWFIGIDGEMPESVRLKQAVSEIINKIMKNVAAILEMSANDINRKEEYKHLLSLLTNVNSLDEAHRMGTIIFGISKVKHYTALEKTTENFDISIKDMPDITINLESHNRKIKDKIVKKAIVDKTFLKEAQIREIMSLQAKEKEILDKYIQNGEIDIKKLTKITKFERRFILALVSAGINKNKEVYNGEHGIKFRVDKVSDDNIIMDNEDGMLEMPDIVIRFGELNND